MDRIGRFEILQRLGEGGMGEVYLAQDPSLDRRVAVKTILPDRNLAPGAQERFLREAKAAGTLSHPNLVTIHEFGEDGGTLYLVMELLPGHDLRTFLNNRSLAPGEMLDVLAQVCDGLSHAHSKGILHRDIKPSNIRVWREEGHLHAKIMDFGLARLPDSDLTATGAVMGTYAYMSPETLATGKSDIRSDTYAVGVILYEAIKGVRPVLAPTLPEAGQAPALQSPAPLPPSALRGVSPRTWDIVIKGMSQDPERRFQSAAELARALREAQDPAWSGFGGPEAELLTLATRDLTAPLPPRGRAPSRPPASLPNLWAAPTPLAERRNYGWLAGLGLLVAGTGLGWWATRPKAPAAAATPVPATIPASTPASVPPAPAPAQSPTPAPVQAPIQEPLPSPALPAATPFPETRPPAEPPTPRPLPPAEAAPPSTSPRDGAAETHGRRLADLYRQARYSELLEAFQRARADGVGFEQLNRVPAFQDAMHEERQTHRVPPSIRIELEPYWPFPPGEGPREGGRRPPERR